MSAVLFVDVCLCVVVVVFFHRKWLVLKQLPKVSKKYSFFSAIIFSTVVFHRLYMNLISVSVQPSLCRTWSEISYDAAQLFYYVTD